MTKVYLYGELRNKFGHEFNFHIGSPREALLAIKANKRNFDLEIKRLAANGVHYRVVVDEEIITSKEQLEITKIPKEVHIVPIVWGAGKNGVLIAVGVLAIVFTAGAAAGALGPALAGAMTTTATTAAGATVTSLSVLGSTMMGLGISLALQGVMGLLFPPPKPDFNQEVQAGGKSYLFGNKPNNASQGQAVPVGYGRLKIGGSQISAGVTHHKMNMDIKQLMAPVNKPIDDYTKLEFVNEAPDSTDGLIQDSFSTNQAVDMNDTISFASATIYNSYIDIISKNAYKVTSSPAEVLVRRDGEVVSNINLDTYDEDIEYEWSLLSEDITKNKIYIEYPYAFKNGLVFRSYHPFDYRLTANLANVQNTGGGFFIRYASGDLVKFGPTQFANLPIGTWDFSYNYQSGELVNYPTGTEAKTYFQALNTGSGFIGTGTEPTGAAGAIRTGYWRKIFEPTEEKIYKALVATSGQLPSTGTNGGNPTFWTGLSSPANKAEFDELISGLPQFKFQGVHEGIVEAMNEQRALGGTLSVDNYAMEFMGYLYIPLANNLKKQVPDTTAGVMYEIIKVGNTGQWAAIGLTGAGGGAIPPKRGLTFVKNSYQSDGDGIVYPVVKYNFKIDSDDAADLYIDGQAASVWYSGHGFANPTTQAGITGMPSTSGEILLTAGFHHLYARFQDGLGSEGISFYYQYDTNWDNGYSDFVVIPADKMRHRPISDINLPEDQKYMPRSLPLPSASMVSGKQYKILDLGTTTNWGSIGASSPRVGTVFTKTNNTAANGNGYVFEDLYNYAESKSSEQNRVVQFSAERPIKNREIDLGYSHFESKYNCKVSLDGITLTTSPVRVKVRFLESDVKLNGVKDTAIPVANYIRPPQ